MTDKRNIPLGKGARTIDDFVRTGATTLARTAGAMTDHQPEAEREVTKFFRLPESLGRRLKVHATQTGQKEKDILTRLIADYLDEHENQS
jgi:hypothetical protein